MSWRVVLLKDKVFGKNKSFAAVNTATIASKMTIAAVN